MAPSYPSIQSFYKREVAAVGERDAEPDGVVAGDGFTDAEKALALNPLSRPFRPTREYTPSDIGQLENGPLPVTFSGRVVNFSLIYGRSKSQTSATGWHNMIVKDDTGAICVKLYFSGKPYPVKLGILITIWTTFISNSPSKEAYIIPKAPIFTSVFPGRDPSVHIDIQNNSNPGHICRTPLNCKRSGPLPDLMTLKAFMIGGSEVSETRILVCVKSIGAKKSFTSKTNGAKWELVEVVVFDDTAEIPFKLWKDFIPTAKEWKPSETILLIANPGFKVEQWGKSSLGMTHATMVDIDPIFRDADWLRKHVTTLKKKENVKQEFPDNVWDIDTATNGLIRILFTIADVDDFVRSNPLQNFTGFLSLIIMELSLVLIRQRNMLMCTECCGIPIYANTTTAACKNCSNIVQLSLNPKIIGTLMDETGSIAPGKLLWSSQAWEELFGRPVDELVASTAQEIRLMEQRMVFMRVTVVFGWTDSVGRLAVLGVRM